MAQEDNMMVCDECGAYGYDDEPIYIFENKELCEECLLEKIESKFWDDIEEDEGIKAECCECHADKEDILYYWDEQWWCKECLLQQFEKAEPEEHDWDDDDYKVDWN